MMKSLHGPIPINLMESLISIAGSESNFSLEITQQFTLLITGQDKDIIIVEWGKNLTVPTDNNLTNTTSIELHTLNVIDAHISEISKNSSFPCLLSLRHTLNSAVNLIYYLLPNCGNDPKIIERLKYFIVPLIFDVRTEYLYTIAHKCLEQLIEGDNYNDTYQLLAYSNILKHSYKLLTDYAELSVQGRPINLDEVILHQILKFWESMLDKPMGLKAMREFFYESKRGSLITVLLSFSNTTMSQCYSTKILQFFDKLFQSLDSNFTVAELCCCVNELGSVEPTKLKNWLNHILLGPNTTITGGGNISSNNSSNVQTPTNMATASGIASISDQALQPSEMILDADAMDIDEECTAANNIGGAGGGGNAGGAGAATNTNGGGARQIPISTTTNRSDVETNNLEYIEKNGRLLQSLTKYIVNEKQISPNVSNVLFQALIQLGQNLLCPSQEALEFSELLQVMVTLADSGQGKGHSALFTAAIEWLDISKNHVIEKYLSKSSTSAGETTTIGATAGGENSLENVSSLLKYMGDLLQGLGSKGSRSLKQIWEDEITPDSDDFYLDDNQNEEEDSQVDDADEDSLCNKLCTFLVTLKEFTNQHWYHCHTCKMVDGVGVCSICARVCHKNHDISYAKYGNFFCDCGSKEDGSCQALVRRSNFAAKTLTGQPTFCVASTSGTDMEQSFRRRTSSPPSGHHHHHHHQTSRANSKDLYFGKTRKMQLAKVIDASKEMLNNPELWKTVIKCLFNFFDLLMPSIEENCAKYSTVGCHLRAKNALERLHSPDKTFVISDQIMVATLGSQEGAFENVRMNYSGEQGQVIRQLLSTNLVRRVGLCCLASPHGKRQHLAVSHEKGKVTILQLSALLKQADASKRKLTLTRLASAPIPCTVLSLSSNPANEDFLAVCGHKECHILTFASNGAANEHIVLTPQLETGNFIKRAIWLPGSQTKLALVTADFVKIYELACDTYSPEYYFLVPSGKIRDCTFAYQDGVYYMLLMASSGYIYTQPLVDESLAQHGPFYVTNTLELDHPLIKDVNGQIGDGGVSIYYSHVLQMLFFSNFQGRSFMAPLTDINAGVKCVMQLQTGPNTKNPVKPLQPLCQWQEIVGHPGIICAMMQNSNNPVIFMLKPDGVIMQEIKGQGSKAKITDMVAIRHAVSGTEKTTLILLCEDGSLRIYAAHAENTGYWLSPEVQPIGSSVNGGRSRKNKRKAGSGSGGGGGAIGGSAKQSSGGANLSAPVFPIDFFEHCTVITEIEYGGNDLLQIYNTQQLKHRLNSTGLFVVSTKANGFTLEVANNDTNMVITGIRILIGTQDPLKSPLHVMVHGRLINTLVTRSRWFDIPLTREESLLSDKKLNIVFGQSHDPENICVLDSIKIYGKTKDVFGWPEESDEIQQQNGNGSVNGNGNNQITNGAGSSVNNQTTSLIPTSSTNIQSIDTDSGNIHTITPLDKMISSMLEVMDNGLNILGGPNVDDSLKTTAIDIATTLLLQPTPNCVQNYSNCVLATLHGNKSMYDSYKDNQILSDVNKELKRMEQISDPRNIDPEAFYRYTLMIRNIAVSRPQTLTRISTESGYNILPMLLKLLKTLHTISPLHDEPCSIVKRGLSHTETIIHSLIEIIYAFALSDQEQIGLMTNYFVELLLDESTIISYSAKHAIIRLLKPRVKRRRVVIGSPPSCSTPIPSTSAGITATDSSSVAVDTIEPLGLEAAGGGIAAAPVSLEALLGGAAGNNFMGFGPHEVDEESIMEIAIALSLQEGEGDLEMLQQNLAALPGIRERALMSLFGGGAQAAGGVGGAADGAAGHSR